MDKLIGTTAVPSLNMYPLPTFLFDELFIVFDLTLFMKFCNFSTTFRVTICFVSWGIFRFSFVHITVVYIIFMALSLNKHKNWKAIVGSIMIKRIWSCHGRYCTRMYKANKAITPNTTAGMGMNM